MSQQLTMVSIGDSLDDTNLITPDIVANANRNIRGWDTGVIDTSFLSASTGAETNDRDLYPDFMWKLVAMGNISNASIGAGMASSYGYDLINHSTLLLSSINSNALVPPASGTKYIFVYIKWDMSNPSKSLATIDIWDNGVNSTWSPSPQDNLESTANGQYIMPLYRIGIDTIGNVDSNSILTWTSLGIATRTGVRYSTLSGVADDSKHARVLQDLSYNSSTQVSYSIDEKIIIMEW